METTNLPYLQEKKKEAETKQHEMLSTLLQIMVANERQYILNIDILTLALSLAQFAAT